MTCGWKGLGDGGFFIWTGWGEGCSVACSMLERGDSKLFQVLSPRFWVGHLVKWRTHLTSAAARVVRAGGSGVGMVACVVWGWGGGGAF
jgi:hypothetical protein